MKPWEETWTVSDHSPAIVRLDPYFSANFDCDDIVNETLTAARAKLAAQAPAMARLLREARLVSKSDDELRNAILREAGVIPK